jgi:protein SCO1/2
MENGCFQIANRKSQIAALALLLAPLTALCGDLPTNATATTYAVKGVFKEAKSGGRTAVIAHENIPGYMEAMTMPFNVKSPAEIRTLEAADVITFRLSVTDTDDWIDQVKKIGRARPRTIAEAGPSMRADSLGDVGAGEPVPECVLTNQAGRRIRMADFKGQALAFTFFFSRCPLPTYCPRMHDNFAAVQHALAEGTRTNWQLLSISFDPAFDTPQQLSDVAARQKVDPTHWNFATSSSAEVRKLGGSFGLEFWRENGTLNHNLRTVVVNTEGRVQRVFRGNEWQPAELVAEMAKAMNH